MSNYDGYRYEAARRRITGTRWAYDDEIRQNLSQLWLMDDHYDACGIPLISDSRTAFVDDKDTHTLILGSTGSKKTRLFAMPMMNIIAKAGESVVCTDPKGELYERTSGLFAKEGYRIVIVNLRDPLHSHGWNPIITAQDYYSSGDKERAISLINDLAATLFPEHPNSKADPFWQQTAASVFSGLCAMIVENNRSFPHDFCNFATLRRLSEELTSPDSSSDKGLTNQMAELYPRSSIARSNLNCIIAGSEKTFMNIMVSYNAPMQVLYSQESLTRMLSTPGIDFSTVGTEKTAFYLIMPDEKTTVHSIVSLMIKQCYESLIHTAQKQERRTLPIRVNFLLDEFANLPTIPDMNSMISAARSRNIRFFLVVQAMSQLRGRYGEDADTIRSNCNNWVFLTSRELELLRELEALCGTNKATGEALISVSQLQRLSKESGEALVLCDRNYPYISHLADIDDYPFAHIPPAPLPTLPSQDKKIPVPHMEKLLAFMQRLRLD